MAPYFEDLQVGHVERTAPAVTLTDGMAAVHQAIVGWHSCEHLAPVHEGDTLYSELELERCEQLGSGGALAHLRSRVIAIGGGADGAGAGGGEDAEGREEGGVPVLDWRFVAVVA
jgi:acyl dehydratase